MASTSVDRPCLNKEIIKGALYPNHTLIALSTIHKEITIQKETYLKFKLNKIYLDMEDQKKI